MKITLRSSSFILFLLGTMLLFAGCATKQAYEGSKLPRESVATIKPTAGIIDAAWILQVDGKERGFFEEIVEVLPGEHTIKIQVTSGFGGIFSPQFVGNKTLSFRASAGHTYKADGTIKKGDTFAWIVDDTTNEVVAGERP